MYEEELKALLTENGADMVGFGELFGEIAEEYPRAVSIIVAIPPEVVRGIHDAPTREYYDAYHSLNARLDALGRLCERFLAEKGFRAYAQTTDRVQEYGNYETRLPHKTAATRAGLGWIGRSALLVAKEYGGAVRLTSVLTDAPLEAAEPITEGLCGSCRACADACPGRAITGKLWSAGDDRAELLDPLKCRPAARARAWNAIHEEITLCGKCFEVCPYTRAYLKRSLK